MASPRTNTRAERACLHCGAEFTPKRRDQVYCTPEHGEAYRTLRTRGPLPDLRPCDECSGEFRPTHRAHRFCSPKCCTRQRLRGGAPPSLRQCEECDLTFMPIRSNQRFCSAGCRVKVQIRNQPVRPMKFCQGCGQVISREQFADNERRCVPCNELHKNGFRTCMKCSTAKPFGEFASAAGGFQGRHSVCRSCCSDAYQERATDPAWKRKSRSAILRRKYGITADQYDELLAEQGGVCAICGDLPGDKAMAVDHDHGCCPDRRTCGKCIRGILCASCNQALGLLHDSIDRVESAAAYLRSAVRS